MFSLRMLLIATFFLSAICADARVIDGRRASHPVIASIADYLDSRGVDVRNGRGTVTNPVSARPQLAELKNFVSAISETQGDPFTSTFLAGVDSDRAYLVAVNSPGTPQTESLTDFNKQWDAAPTDKRVFISFSGADLEHAKIAANGLRQNGYLVFLFKNGATELPAVNPVETGKFFREAGHHLVIDTFNARMSVAVAAEAQALVGTPRRPLLGILGSSPPRRNNATPAGPTPCCRLCTYENGIEVSCEPPVCDAVYCQNAR